MLNFFFEEASSSLARRFIQWSSKFNTVTSGFTIFYIGFFNLPPECIFPSRWIFFLRLLLFKIFRKTLFTTLYDKFFLPLIFLNISNLFFSYFCSNFPQSCLPINQEVYTVFLSLEFIFVLWAIWIFVYEKIPNISKKKIIVYVFIIW